MAVVADSGPLIALSRIQHLDLLPSLYGEVVVPASVLREVTGDVRRIGASELAQVSWLRVAEVSDQTAVHVLQFSLDRGESEAIVLARQLQVLLLIDERRGRAVADALGISKTGTVGVLLAAKQAGLVGAICPLLDALQTAGVRLSPRLYQEACRLAGEATG